MAITSGFFNAQVDEFGVADRLYDAEQMSSIFDGIIRDGVFAFIGDKFKVTIGGENAVNIGTGRAWFDHVWILNDAVYPLVIPATEVALNRIDVVVFDIDRDIGVRNGSISVIKGIPAAVPSQPAMIREEERNTYPIAYIRRVAGRSLTQADITVVVGTGETPFVTGPIATIGVDLFVDAMYDDWLTWFDSVKDILNDTPVGNLINRVMDLETDVGSLTDEIDNITTQLAQKITKDRGAITSSDLSQEVKEQMTGGSVAVVGKNTVLNENIVDGQVTPNKVSFLSKGINKFNGDYSKSALLSDGILGDTPGAITIIIPINGGETYHIAKDAGNRNRLAWHRGIPKVGETLDYFVGDLPAGRNEVIAPPDAQYMVFMVSFGEDSPNIRTQVTEGEDYPFFVGYDFIAQENIIGLNKLVKNIEDLYFRDNISNFAVKRFIDLKYTSNGWLESVKISPNTRLFYNGTRVVIANTGEEIPVPDDPQRKYVYIAIDPNVMELKVGRMDYVSKSFPREYILIGIAHPGPDKKEFYGIDGDSVSINDKPYINPAIVAEIDKRTEEIDKRIEEISLPELNKSKYFFLEDLNGIYDKPSEIPDGSSGTELNLINSNHSIIYDIYDGLLTNYPDYVTKKVLGQDSSGLDINQYTFKAPRIGNENNLTINVPKVVTVGGVHGYEQGATYSMAMFFKDLCENWGGQKTLEFLRWNVDFVVMPMANPYGYDNNQRKNYNGVDINRNFFEGTTTSGNPIDDYFGGYNGMSEPETQIIASFIEGNLDAEFYIDYHNIASGYPMSYTHNETDRAIMNNLYRTLSKKWSKDYPQSPQDGTMMGYLKGKINDTTTSYALEQGLQPVLLETPWKMPFANSKYDKITLETGTEAYGNLLVTLLKSLR